MKTLSLVLLSLSLLLLASCGPKLASKRLEAETSLATAEWLDKSVGILPFNTYLNGLAGKLSSSIHKAALETPLRKKQTRDFQNYPWQVFVLDTETLNAFSSGAGALYITKGLLKLVRDEGELAAILSHEMAHQLLDHPRAALTKTGAGLLSPQLAFSLKQEMAADELGVKILTVSGYDPRSALSALTYGYRNSKGVVSIRDRNLEKRIANIYAGALVGGFSQAFSTRSDSREFRRFRGGL